MSALIDQFLSFFFLGLSFSDDAIAIIGVSLLFDGFAARFQRFAIGNNIFTAADHLAGALNLLGFVEGSIAFGLIRATGDGEQHPQIQSIAFHTNPQFVMATSQL